MTKSKQVLMLYGKEGMELSVPDSTTVLEGQNISAISNPEAAVLEALANPIGSAPLGELLAKSKPRTVAITISDITRPVPNKAFLPPMLKLLNASGIADSNISIIIGTGMHRPSTDDEREYLVGKEISFRRKYESYEWTHQVKAILDCNTPSSSDIHCRRFVVSVSAEPLPLFRA